jgi:hypothetical protein
MSQLAFRYVTIGKRRIKIPCHYKTKTFLNANAKSIFFDRPQQELIPMPTMKIRGGDLDLVEYEFTSYPPGTNLKTLGFEKKEEAAGKNIYFDHLKV